MVFLKIEKIEIRQHHILYSIVRPYNPHGNTELPVKLTKQSESFSMNKNHPLYSSGGKRML